MPTNDEIEQKHREFRRMYGFADWDKEVDVMLNEARADTAKQIFADLEKNDTGYGDIVLAKEELQALKKQYNIEE